MTVYTVRRYEQLETFPETIEQELRPAVCEHRQTDRLKANYSIDKSIRRLLNILLELDTMELDTTCLYNQLLAV